MATRKITSARKGAPARKTAARIETPEPPLMDINKLVTLKEWVYMSDGDMYNAIWGPVQQVDNNTLVIGQNLYAVRVPLSNVLGVATCIEAPSLGNRTVWGIGHDGTYYAHAPNAIWLAVPIADDIRARYITKAIRNFRAVAISRSVRSVWTIARGWLGIK